MREFLGGQGNILEHIITAVTNNRLGNTFFMTMTGRKATGTKLVKSQV